MNFIVAIKSFTHLSQWYSAISDPIHGCLFTSFNLRWCSLFPVNDPATDMHLKKFETRLPSVGTPITKNHWQGASNGPGNAVCILQGPVAIAPARLVRTQTLDGIWQYALSEASDHATPEELAKFLDNHPRRTEALRAYLRPHAAIRGSLRVAFWADKDDVDAFRAVNRTAGGLRRFLGIDDLPLGPGHLLVVELNDGGKGTLYERKVPTGFDAYDNPYFEPQAPGSTTGFTRNIVIPLQPGFDHGYAKEVVTSEVRMDDVAFEPNLVNPP